MFKAAAKLRLNSRLDDLARHSPVRERDPEDLPGFNFPRGYAAEPILFSIVSPLDPNFLHMPLHKDGVEVTPHPLAPLAELAARNDPNSPLLAGQLTATYPRAFEPQLGREEIVNYPNQDGWFTVVMPGCTYGATVDGCGGDGPLPAWVAAHVTLAVAVRMMAEGLRYVSSTRGAAGLMQSIIKEAHKQLIELDEKGSTAVLLHMAFHVTGKRHIFCFACTGDTEVYVYDSAAGHWRYLIELIGATDHLLRTNASKVPGAIGKDAMLEKGRLNPATNLQYGVTVAAEDDVFLAATDGVWDTLDPVQNGGPRQCGLDYDRWEQVPPRQAQEIVQIGPVIKQRRLGEVIGRERMRPDAPVAPILDAIVDHAFKATRGERELFQMVDVPSGFQQSIYDDRQTAKGETSILQDAKRASELEGQYIFAKPDHVGVQAFKLRVAMEYDKDRPTIPPPAAQRTSSLKNPELWYSPE